MTGRHSGMLRPLSVSVFQMRLSMLRAAVLLVCLSFVVCQNITTTNMTATDMTTLATTLKAEVTTMVNMTTVTESPTMTMTVTTSKEVTTDIMSTNKDVTTNPLAMTTMSTSKDATATDPAMTTTAVKEITTDTMSTSKDITTFQATTSIITTAVQSTDAITTKVEQSTGNIMSTFSSTSAKAGTTAMTTNVKNPPVLSTGIIALIGVVGALVFILVLAGFAYLCQRRNVKVKRRASKGSHRDSNLSIHRPESGMILDDGDTTKMNTFNTNRKVETLGCDNPYFMNEDDLIEKGKTSEETGEIEQNGKATLPSRASLIVADETKTNKTDTTPANGEVQSGKASDQNVDINATETQPAQEQQNPASDDMEAPPPDVESRSNSDKPDEQRDSTTGLSEPSVDYEPSSRPQSGVSYKSTDMEDALQQVGEELKI